MSLTKQRRTIKDARKDLGMWGRFWANQEVGRGYASVSVTERLRQMLDLGLWASSDLHLYSDTADAVYVPSHIEVVDKAISKLPGTQQRELAQKYIKGKTLDNYHTREGENTLITAIVW